MEDKRRSGEEIGMLKEMLLFICNKSHEEFYTDPFIRAVITQIAILIGDLRHKTTEQYVSDYKEAQKQLELRMSELKNLGGMGPLEYDQKMSEIETNVIRPFEVIKGALDEELEKVNKHNNNTGPGPTSPPDVA